MSSDKAQLTFEENYSSSKESHVLKKLLPEYVSLYRIELNSGEYDILRLASNTNARYIAENSSNFKSFDEYARQYADSFILEEDKNEFLDWHLCKNMKKRLGKDNKITYHYHSVSKEGNDSYYEAYAVKEVITGDRFVIFLGYRNIDSILYKERAIQEKLRKALEETKLQNEIISAIAKTYQYISRIDIAEDWFEEITNRDKVNLKFANYGVMSEGNKKVCKDQIAEEYQEAFFRFTDLSTLPERMKNEQTIDMEYRMKDGNWHKLRFIEKKRDENGRLTHVLCAIRSISAAKKKEQELLYQVAEARKDAALKNRFLSNMSHDIRTPMNGIIGMVNLANRYPDDPEIQKNCRDKIMESSKYLVSLVNDILDMNKLESGDLVNQEMAFDLAELLSRTNAGKLTQATEKNIEYVVDWEKTDIRHVYLTGNPLYLERLLNAIADNAVKFTNPGGCVHVWCRESAIDDIHAEYKFYCADNGIGMNESFLEHAFDVFSQENETSRSTYQGTGLGLAIAKRLAERLDGTIGIESHKNQGTTVTVTVPFKIGEEKRMSRLKSQDEVILTGMRALIVEDNELNMEIVNFMLEENGILAEGAGDGVEGVEKFAASAPGYYNVILMDIMMPRLNGWDTTRKIRSLNRPDAATVPIVAMSANAFAEDIINSRTSGMNVHLAKPLDEKKLMETLRSLFV